MKTLQSKNLQTLLCLLAMSLAFGSNLGWASASPTDTVMELTEGTGEISSSSTNDKMEARQIIADAERYYADPAAPMGNELMQQVQLLKQQHPEFSTVQAVDFIYERALKQ